MAYNPKHARSTNRTGPIIIATTAALVAAVPGVAAAQALIPSHEPTITTQPQPAIDTSRDLFDVKREIAKVRGHFGAAKASHHRHRARRRSQTASKPVYAPAHVLGGTLTESQLAALWVRAGGNPAYAHIASAVAMAESTGRQYAHSGTSDFGYWQINGSWGRLATYDALGNAKAAILISRNGRNWAPWTTFVSGAYLKYM